MDTSAYDYYYGQESDQYSFFKIPRVLIEDERFKGLSLATKFLYGVMLSRMELSQKSGWFDKYNRVYIYFSVDEVMKVLDCGREKAVRHLAELDKEYSLIERKRQGQGKPSIIYVKHPEVPESNCIYTYDSYTDSSQKEEDISTYLPEYQAQARSPNDSPGDGGMDRIGNLQTAIKKQIEYDILKLQYRSGELDEIVEIMTEIAMSTDGAVRIGSRTLNIEFVKKRYQCLDQFHIEYVMQSMAENKSEVRNIKAYLISALFNAPATIDHYYSNQINSDTDKYSGG